MNDPPVVVVTGPVADIGRAIVRAFARQRARLGLLARNAEGLAVAAVLVGLVVLNAVGRRL